MTDKLPPHNSDAENGCIGSVLIDPEQLAGMKAILSPDDFHQEKSRWAWEAVLDAERRGEVNQLTVWNALDAKKRLDAVGREYLSLCVAHCDFALLGTMCAREVHRLAVARRLILAAGTIARIGYEPGQSTAAELVTKAQRVIDDLDDATSKTPVKNSWGIQSGRPTLRS